MAKYKIGITEAGDAGIDLSWTNKLNSVDGAVVITKCVSTGFYNAAITHKAKLIIHATITGFGGTILEPMVPSPYEEFVAINALIKGGFPKEKMVIRIDPIIPTKKGIERAMAVMEYFIDAGFNRFRISVIDMYPHVRARFYAANIPSPYGDNFFASREQMTEVDAMLREVKEYYFARTNRVPLRIESCAEPYLKEPIACGCISEYDLRLLGLDPLDADALGRQRKHCMCYSGKTELLSNKTPCKHQCLYCYWKHQEE